VERLTGPRPSEDNLAVNDTSAVTLVLTNDFGPRTGGIQTFLHGLVERLPRGSVVVYTSQQGDTEEYDQLWWDNYGVHVMRDRAKLLLPTPRVLWNVRNIMKAQKPENLIFGAAAPLAIAARFLKADRVIALTHGHEIWWAKVPPLNVLMRLIGNSVDHITYLGDFTKNGISKSLSEQGKAKLIQIAPGIDTEKFRPTDSQGLREELGIADKDIIVSVGRLVPRKGHDTLIKALPTILEAIPSAHLLLVGTGPYQDRLQNLVSERKLDEHVTFVGRVPDEDLVRHICAGDIFAMPSRTRLAGLEVEGLGIAYLEASACGIPVLAGNSGGAPDAVRNGVTGLVVNGLEVNEVAMGVIRLLFGDRHAMGSAGRQWAVAHWDWSIWADRFKALLEVDSSRARERSLSQPTSS
jgi:phosphatidyl-myo-inositol dimannoside synthase